MAYIPWWQRYEAPTFAERFNLGGLAGQQLVKKTDELRPGFAGITKNIKNVDDVPYLKTAESGPASVFSFHVYTKYGSWTRIKKKISIN